MSQSVRDRVAARRRELRRQVEAGELFMIPGYDGALWVKLAYLPPDENQQINARHNGDGTTVAAMAGKLVIACRGLYESEDREPPGPDAEPVTHDGVPVGFDRDLAALYEFLDDIGDGADVDPVDVVRELIPKEYGIEILHDAWAFWLQFSASGVADTLAGESVPTPT